MDLIFYGIGMLSLVLILVGTIDYIIGKDIGEIYPFWKDLKGDKWKIDYMKVVKSFLVKN